MGDVGIDTAVRRVDERRWRATLSEDWNIWGPNGGYVASVCLRAAGAASGMDRPATIACHYLAVGEFDDVDLDVTVLRATRRTAAVRVHMSQAGSSLAESTVWGVADGLDGYRWHEAEAPQVPSPQDTASIEERLADQPQARSPFSFGRNFEQRPVQWRSPQEWETFPGGPHTARNWMRFVPTSTFDDPWIDACRALILLDTWVWPAASGGLSAAERGRFLAPNLDVTARFHTDASTSEWLLVDAEAPVAGDGLIGTSANVWTDDGRLAASAGAQLFCRTGPTAG